MKTYKLSYSHHSYGAIEVPAQSQGQDGTTWTLYKGGELKNEAAPKDRQNELWSYKVGRMRREGQKNFPFEFINVPELGIDYFADSSLETESHAMKMQNLIKFLKNHYMVSRFETNAVSGEKEQSNRNFKNVLAHFVLVDESNNEREEFFKQRAKNKARSIVDDIYEESSESNDKSKMVSLAYGVGVEEPFRKTMLQLYNTIISIIDKTPKKFIDFVKSKDREYHVCLTMGLIGINEHNNPPVKKEDGTGRMFLGEIYLGTSIEDAVGYLKSNPDAFDYLKTEIKYRASDADKLQWGENANAKAEEASDLITQSATKPSETVEQKELTKMETKIKETRETNAKWEKKIDEWIKKFRDVADDQEKVKKVAEAFEVFFMSYSAIAKEKGSFLKNMEKRAEEMSVAILITPFIRDIAEQNTAKSN